MRREILIPRPDWQARVEALGFTYHTHDHGPYWDESLCYVLTGAEVDALESAGNALHALYLEAAQAVIDRNWFARLGIPDLAVPAIDRGAELPPSAGLPMILGCRERAQAFLSALEKTTGEKT